MSPELSEATRLILEVEQVAKASKNREIGMSDEAYNKVRQVSLQLCEFAVGSEVARNLASRTHYFTAPGSPVNLWFHSNFEGGLMLHSLFVTLELIRLAEVYEAFLDDEKQIVRVGLFHDMCKAVYNQPPDDFHEHWWYKRPMYPGHADATLAVLPTLGIYLNEKETAAIRWHMGAYNVDKDTLKYYDVAKKRYPREVLVTHWADMAAANFHEWSVTPVSEDEQEKKTNEQKVVCKD